MKKLSDAFELIKPLILKPINQDNIPRSIKTKAKLLLNLSEAPQQGNIPIRGGVQEDNLVKKNALMPISLS